MSIFTNPSKILENIVDSIFGSAKNIWALVEPAIMRLKRDSGEFVMEVALTAVTQLATTDLSNSDKREKAVDMIKDAAVAAGKQFIESHARWAIETAVQIIKAKKEGL